MNISFISTSDVYCQHRSAGPDGSKLNATILKLAFGGKLEMTKLLAIKEEIESGRIKAPVNGFRITEGGLQAVIRNSGTLSWYVNYIVTGGSGKKEKGSSGRPKREGNRTTMLIGHYPEITINRARHIAETIIELGRRGIDPMDGLHRSLIKSIEKHGLKWTPDI